MTVSYMMTIKAIVVQKNRVTGDKEIANSAAVHLLFQNELKFSH